MLTSWHDVTSHRNVHGSLQEANQLGARYLFDCNVGNPSVLVLIWFGTTLHFLLS